MPTSVTSSSGISFHLWQLPDLSAPEPVDSIEFTTLENELSQGYRESVLFGSDTGVREWKLSLPTLAGSSVPMPTVTDPFGATVSREQYVRNLYKYNRTTGKAFAYQWPATTGQYYLVDFANDSLAYQRKKNVNIYSTDIVLRQRRLNGITIFNVEQLSGIGDQTLSLWLKASAYTDGTEEWTPSIGGGFFVTGTGDVNKIAAAQNGLDVVRFNSSASTGSAGDVGGPQFKEVFIAMKVREATFSNNAGILTGTGAASPQVLTGASGTTKFTNPALTASDFIYQLDGTTYAQNNMQAPMDTWGVVHLRYTTGWDLLAGFQIGKNRTTAGTFAKIDVGEVIVSTNLLAMDVAREVNEYLGVKWGVI